MKALRLFGLFPLPESAHPAHGDRDSERRLLADYGIALDAAARPYAAQIAAAVQEDRASFAALNRTFYTWRQAAETSVLERLCDQIAHYLSTYGAEAINAPYEPQFVFWPLEGVDETVHERSIPLLLVRGVRKATLADACFAALNTPAGMKTETIDDIITCLLDEAEYHPRGDERFANREAQVRFAMRIGAAEGEDMLRWFVLQATGASLMIKNPSLLKRIESSGFVLPALDDAALARLAESFHRHRPIWIAFKRANRANAPMVNRLRRMATTRHRPLATSPLMRVTSDPAIDLDDLKAAAMRAPLAQVTRAYYAALMAASICEPHPIAHRVRNGKAFVRENAPPRGVNPAYLTVLRDVIRLRLQAIDPIPLPAAVTPALPQSERQIIAGLPAGSSIAVPDGCAIAIGVHWRNNRRSQGWESRVDLDLSAIDDHGRKIGWNAEWRRSESGDTKPLSDDDIVYSGDMTNAPLPDGASEWLWFGPEARPALVVVNRFDGDADRATLTIAAIPTSQPAPQLNWVAPADAILWQGEIAIPNGQERELTIGFVRQGRITLTGETTGAGRVAYANDLRSAMLRFIQRRADIIAADEPLVPTCEGTPIGAHVWLSLLTAFPTPRLSRTAFSGR